MTSGLTPRMAQCLKAIRELTVDGVPPSYEELRVRLDLKNKGNVHVILSQLAGRGLVAWEPRLARSLRIIERPSFDDLNRLDDYDLKVTRSLIDEVLHRRQVARLTGQNPARAEPRP